MFLGLVDFPSGTLPSTYRCLYLGASTYETTSIVQVRVQVSYIVLALGPCRRARERAGETPTGTGHSMSGVLIKE